MKPSHLGSELERTGFILRLGAEDQIREYDRKFGLAKTAYQDLISNLIVQEVSYDRAFLDAQNLFGDTTVRFAAVDGTEYSQFLFDLIIFFGGAYSLKGDLTFHSDRLPSLTYDQTVLQGGRGVSSCIPLYINEAVDLDQTILEIGDQDQLEMTKPLTDEMIIKNLTIADQIMSFSEIYLAYALASDPNESIKLLLLDRSLYTMHSSLLYDTSIRGLWKSCSLLGFEVDGEKIDLNDLGYGRHRLLHQTLRVPPFRGEYLRYSLIYLLEISRR